MELVAHKIGPLGEAEYPDLNSAMIGLMSDYTGMEVVIELAAGNYHVKLAPITPVTEGTHYTEIVAKKTSAITLEATGTLTFRHPLYQISQPVAYTGYTVDGENLTFAVDFTADMDFPMDWPIRTSTKDVLDLTNMSEEMVVTVSNDATGLSVIGGTTIGESSGVIFQEDVVVLESVGKLGDRYASAQEAVDDIEAGTSGVAIPTEEHPIWLLIERNTESGVLTVTNPYLFVQLVSGADTLKVPKPKSGYIIQDHVMVLQSTGGEDDLYATAQDAVDDIEAGNVLSLGTPSDTNTVYLIIERNIESGTLTRSNPYLIIQVISGNPLDIPGVVNPLGYEVQGEVFILSSVGLPGNTYATTQAAVLAIEAGTAGVPIPTNSNDVWLLIERNHEIANVTVTNRYLHVELVSGMKTIKLLKGW